MFQELATAPPTPVTQSTTVLYGLAAVAIGQLAVLVGQWVTARGARTRERDLAETNTAAAAAVAKASADAIAAAAKLVDDRAERDRKWLVEDRRALASELAAKVQATADTLAVKVAIDANERDAVTRAHAAELALQTRHEQTLLATTVRSAEISATAAVVDIKAAIDQVGDKADAAYQEANHVNNKISDLNAELLRVKTNGDTGGPK
ncbi:MAG TPA: hypothetical protein VKR23_16160 [Gaiellaceae bacterium]|nr:hypothetical protein [Gaiellaceae bacterium]